MVSMIYWSLKLVITYDHDLCKTSTTHFKVLYRHTQMRLFVILMFQAYSEEAWASQHVWDLGKGSVISSLIKKKNHSFNIVNIKPVFLIKCVYM